MSISDLSTSTIILGILFIGWVVFLVKFWKNKKMRYTILSVSILLMGIITILSHVDFSKYTAVPHQIVSDQRLVLSIEKTDSRAYLMNGDEEAEYVTANDEQPKILTDWYPIYLNEIENYYIVVFSKDMEREIIYDRFRQGDYEWHQNLDGLFVIEKNSGFIFYTADYDLIGHEIDLNSFQEGNRVVTFNVYLPYEDKISYVRYLHYTDEYTIDDSLSMYENRTSEPMGGNWIGMVGHTHTLGDPSWVEAFILAGDLYYYEDSYGTAYYGYLDQQSVWIQFKEYYDLSNEIYAKQGYLKFDNDGLYFVDNQLNLIYLNASIPTIIESDITLDEWESLIQEIQ